MAYIRDFFYQTSVVTLLWSSSILCACELPQEEKKHSSTQLIDEIITHARKNGPFQDIFLEGSVVYSSENSAYCSARYDYIKKCIVSVFGRATSSLLLLDLGAAQGYFSLRLAHELDLMAVMVDTGDDAYRTCADHSQQLLKICKAQAQKCKIMVLANSLDKQMLYGLNLFDHFNVILALNILHYCKDWKECINSILAMGDLIFIELPVDHEDTQLQAIHDTLKAIKNWSHVTVFSKPSGRKTLMYVLIKQPTESRQSLTWFNCLRGNCVWPEIKQVALAQVPQCLAPSEVLINHRGDVLFDRRINGDGQIQSRL